VCRPTPVARIVVFKVRCFNIDEYVALLNLAQDYHITEKRQEFNLLGDFDQGD
jgi:hypothetical protein